ncbi:unnamed protein product [Ectocarpus fasciculatus]
MSLIVQESVFRRKVDLALEQVRRVLETNKHPVYASEAAHKYGDKYLLAEFLTNAALASHLTSLSNFGVTAEQLTTMMEWSKSRSVSLRFDATERCKFLKKVTRDEDSATKHVTDTSHFGKFTSKVVTTITEYLWEFQYSYELLAYRGTGDSAADRLAIGGRSCTHQITTSTDKNPRKESVVRPHSDVNVTWLLCTLQSPSAGVVVPAFAIDRSVESCRTPSNNANVAEASRCFESMASWVGSVHSYFTSQIYPLLSGSALDLSAVSSDGVFVPVLPVFNQGEAGSLLFGVGDITSFLTEEQRSLTEKYSAMDTVFRSSALLMSAAEARLLVTLLHARDVIQFHQSGLHAIEEMLRNQLVAAVGKVVSPSDFSNYMRFHNNKVFAEAYRPKPFCFAVRRSTTHSPEGVLSVEEELADGSMADPIYTVCNGPADGSLHPMRFTLNAATSVTFHGERYVHAWLSQKFRYSQYDSNESKLSLKANSRQFSSFIVLIGRISSADSFDPKFGMIVQNKDEVSIPLDLERIPSAKEFKDAIDSLSPEQQAFAKAFRGMQLESTLFGVCVIQIKPQLEKLLRLSADSLTKEIQLTQDLMELFITYQLPSDLLSFSGAEDAPSSVRIAEVKGYVKAMHDMIQASKERELAEKKQQDKYNSISVDDLDFVNFGSSPSCDVDYFGGLFLTSQPDHVVGTPTSNAQQRGVIQDDEAASEASVDYTKIPGALEKQFEALDKEGAVRPTIINPGSVWTKRAQKALLADPTSSTLGVDEQKSEKNRAFDLMDALSRSGGLSVDHASLHVVVAATHCFDLSLMDTIVKNNVNPIEKVERSTMIMASAIHGEPVESLVREDHSERLNHVMTL